MNIPIIASGGGGNPQHFLDLFKETDVSAGLAASILHSKTYTVADIKHTLRKGGVPVR